LYIRITGTRLGGTPDVVRTSRAKHESLEHPVRTAPHVGHSLVRIEKKCEWGPRPGEEPGATVWLCARRRCRTDATLCEASYVRQKA
jgi:hypothetical protein